MPLDHRAIRRIFIHSHCKVRSRNPKRGCACREKKKRIPDFDHTYCVQGLNNYLTKLDYRKWK